MTIYKPKTDYYDEDTRWTLDMVREDAEEEGMTPEEFIEEFLEEDTEARFWLDFGYGNDYDSPFELKLVGTNDTVWEGTFADAGISEADVEALRAIDKLDEFFQRELGIDPDRWEVG